MANFVAEKLRLKTKNIVNPWSRRPIAMPSKRDKMPRSVVRIPKKTNNIVQISQNSPIARL
jgi:hypothetical protein